MDYDNYMELYEAVYFFNRIFGGENGPLRPISPEAAKEYGIGESVFKALVRILIAAGLLERDGSGFALSNENRERHRRIIDNIINKNQKAHYSELFDKAAGGSRFFFDGITELEYEIYSKCNFQVTFETGKEVARHVDLTGSKVLELGGNSGGLGTALTERYENCGYTVVDTAIPCAVGNEIKAATGSDIVFAEGDVFQLALPRRAYDYIIIMNLLHDFDDAGCAEILRGCAGYCGKNTRFLIIEDMLTDEYGPAEVVMHGLRLAVECGGGRQRTVEELAGLFSGIGYAVGETVRISGVHTMLVMSKG